ncbi:hypothetical protein [Sphingomonas sp.]|uniref:hypothetical protein n=1 Tax=Sphingomonas sp. TaxID=28214 RepID=UPI003B3A0B8D
MTRAPLSYGTRHEPRTDWAGHDAETPVAGFYRMRLRSGGVFVAVKLWHGLPLDPETLDELDRAPCWNALINGAWANVTDAWPRCADEPVDAQEYAFLLSRVGWAAQHAPDSPVADPTKRVDPLSSPLLF